MHCLGCSCLVFLFVCLNGFEASGVRLLVESHNTVIYLFLLLLGWIFGHLFFDTPICQVVELLHETWFSVTGPLCNSETD